MTSVRGSSFGMSRWLQQEKEPSTFHLFLKKDQKTKILMVRPGMKLRHAVAAHVSKDQYLATIGGGLLGPDKTVAELGLLSGGTLQVVGRLRGGGFSTGKGGFGRPARDEYVPFPGEWQCNVCHGTRCWGTRNTCYRCGYPRGADRVVLGATSPGLTVRPLGRVAATRGSAVNPSYRVSTPGAGIGSFSGGKGNGAGVRNPLAAGGVVEVPQGLRVVNFVPTFSFTSGLEEVAVFWRVLVAQSHLLPAE